MARQTLDIGVQTLCELRVFQHVRLLSERTQKLQLRYTPELVFELDDSLKYGAHMYDLLSRLSAQEKREEPEHDDNT